MSGRGTFTEKSGSYYIGRFLNGDYNGYGIYFWFNTKDIYEGEWSNGIRNGQGKFTSSDGTICDCMYFNNRRHGYGELRFSNSDLYKGSFIDGQRAGEGEYIFNDGTIEKGTFLNDTFIQGLITYPNGKKKKYKKKKETTTQILRHGE